MSKERARRRAERIAVQEREQLRRDRRQRRRAAIRKLRPRKRGVGRLARYSRGQRIGIALVPLIAIAAIWVLVPDPALRLVLILMIVLVLPALVVVVLGRR